MNYQQAVEYIDSFLVFGSKPGLRRISNLMRLLGDPQKSLKFIHVAGTNGKGSVCAYISCILKAAGLKTGMFVSPYVFDYTERFQINGEQIDRVELCEIVSLIKSAVDKIDDDLMPTEFEIVTAIGLMYFYRQKCDVVVLETGLGGLYDSTNIIDTPLCSVITSISLDHTAVLGDTVDKIAGQKAGIIKQGGTTVIYPIQQKSALDVIERTAQKQRNRVIIPNLSEIKNVKSAKTGVYAVYCGIEFKAGISGDVQLYNAITAIEAARAAFPNISKQAVISGIGAARMPARCEIIDKNRPIILDGAHNPDGVLPLKSLIRSYSERKFTAVMGMMRDKDYNEVMRLLAPCFDKILTVTVANDRSLSADELKAAAEKYCQNTLAADDIKTAVKTALEGANGVVICGSFYLMSEVIPYLQQSCGETHIR